MSVIEALSLILDTSFMQEVLQEVCRWKDIKARIRLYFVERTSELHDEFYWREKFQRYLNENMGEIASTFKWWIIDLQYT